MRQQKHIIQTYEAGLQNVGNIDARASHLMLYLSAALQKQIGKHEQWKRLVVGAMEDTGHSHSETFQRRESRYRGYENDVSLHKSMSGSLVRGKGAGTTLEDVRCGRQHCAIAKLAVTFVSIILAHASGAGV